MKTSAVFFVCFVAFCKTPMKFDYQTRRSFARAVLAGLLGLLGVTLVRRAQVCTRGGACDGCALFAKCTLPQKQEQR